jgi:hypothetical protein
VGSLYQFCHDRVRRLRAVGRHPAGVGGSNGPVTRGPDALDARSAETRSRVRQYLGISKVRIENRDRVGEPIPPPNRTKFARGPETELHRKLKRWLADHPDAVSTFGEFKKGEPECWLASGDRLDVLFTNARTRLAAEVKTSDAPNEEVQRGIYQCVKYRATLRAMQLAAMEPPNAQAVLVIDCHPTSIVRRLAERLSVAIVDVSKEFNGNR